MSRRGFTLIEVLVALVIMGFISGMVMTVFQYQNRNWKTESDKADVAMMARGTLEELTRAIRMTGGWLPDVTAGLQVYGSGEERVTFVLNGAQWVDSARGSTFVPSEKKLRIAVDSSERFSQDGNAFLNLMVPPSSASSPTPGSVNRMFRLPILERISSTGGCGDSLVLDARLLTDSPNSWNWSAAIGVSAKTLVYNLDSVSYRKSRDTLYTRWNRQPEGVYALGVDSLRIQYWHPVAGWGDSLSGSTPANRIEKVRVRLVMRTRKVDKKLLAQSPASRGYRFSTMETEVALRNDSLVNR